MLFAAKITNYLTSAIGEAIFLRVFLFRESYFSNVIRGRKFPHAAYGDGDVRDCSLVDDAQFLARRAVHRPRHVAVVNIS